MTTFDCFKCNGSGEVAFRHIANGVCFQCGGTGKLSARKAAPQSAPRFPVIPESDRCTMRQWSYLERLCRDDDAAFRRAVYAAGAPCANAAHISRAVMSKAIEIAKQA